MITPYELYPPTFYDTKPFNHCVIDDFLPPEIAAQVSVDFPHYDDPEWYGYDNPIEHKKTLNNWYRFPPTTYALFSYLCSRKWCDRLGNLFRRKLYADYGLHGGGWHIHGPGGNLNPHLDYSIHPKLQLQRKLNIIIYLTPDWQEEWGGALGLWTNNDGKPGTLIREVVPHYNRAIIFDTTQDSWHGMSKPLSLPAGQTRRSVAVFYLCDPPSDLDTRKRALFAPRENQIGDEAVEKLIKERAKL